MSQGTQAWEGEVGRFCPSRLDSFTSQSHPSPHHPLPQRHRPHNSDHLPQLLQRPLPLVSLQVSSLRFQISTFCFLLSQFRYPGPAILPPPQTAVARRLYGTKGTAPASRWQAVSCEEPRPRGTIPLTGPPTPAASSVGAPTRNSALNLFRLSSASRPWALDVGCRVPCKPCNSCNLVARLHSARPVSRSSDRPRPTSRKLILQSH